MDVCFTVPGNPLGWQRAGQNRHTKVIFTQEKTRQRKNLVAWEYKKTFGNFRFPAGSQLEMVVTAFMPIPKSASKEKHRKMVSGEIRPTVKPDWDNIGKLISDALNEVAYDDDKSIVDSRVLKYYSETPRTVVQIKEIIDDGFTMQVL